MTYAAQFSEDDNVGSVIAISLAMKNWLSSVKPVSFLGTYGWEAMDFLPESASVQDSSKDSDNGTEYTYNLVFAFNKQNANLYNTFKKYLGMRGIIMFTDGNGLTRIIGTPEYPVTITHTADTGQAFNNLNYYKIAATWQSANPAIIVS